MNKINDLELYQEAFLFQKIGNEAVKEAIQNNVKKNIASVFSKDGKIYYKLPSGEITQNSPFITKT
ncbi:hypothetical protein PQO01_06745 [Lentisphaera marina]|jgi:hypothetical protein|uniref:Uncharacterized protein n=1 Tax=Lentisphaera profundi TaxID=1658616 RepID=A0ABY7VMJ2_9BACT|nr:MULTISPECIES: hypothetical protein [Lentisphaera]MDD7984645.1 hypothetical protein [Lentisphaera marina]WDE95225.1 hypothetical protein PQO03_05755 [Lentisphaera profundi]